MPCNLALQRARDDETRDRARYRPKVAVDEPDFAKSLDAARDELQLLLTSIDQYASSSASSSSQTVTAGPQDSPVPVVERIPDAAARDFVVPSHRPQIDESALAVPAQAVLDPHAISQLLDPAAAQIEAGVTKAVEREAREKLEGRAPSISEGPRWV